MSMRRAWSPSVRLALLVALLAPAVGLGAGPGGEDSRTAMAFVRGLRERGLFDLATDYLEALRQAPDLPGDLKPLVDYEAGRNLLESASVIGDLERRRELLDGASTRLDAFTKTYPSHPLAAEALVQFARLMVERGHLATLLAEEAKTPAEKQGKMAEARAGFGRARESYDAAIARLKPLYNAFPKYIDDKDPRRAERDRFQAAMIDAQLQRAVVDFEEGETHPADSAERKRLMGAAETAFHDVHDRYRQWLAGFGARMYQGRCLQEKGEIGPAIGIYNELLDHGDPQLRDLQRKVAYFKIMALAQRGEHALAADEASRWLQANGSHRRDSLGLGVQFELAKAIIAQLPEITKPADHDAAIRRVSEALTEVVRNYSPHKSEALALLRKYRPRTAANATALSSLNYDGLRAEADDAIANQEWKRALAASRLAVRKAESARDLEPRERLDRINRNRFLMAYSYYSNGQFYESAAVAEHLARNYPAFEFAPRASDIAIQATLDSYNTDTRGDRTADLGRLVELARYAAQTWPESEHGDFGRMIVGEVELGRGHYAEAVSAFEAVRTGSGKWADAQVRSAKAHWKFGQVLRAADPPATAEADAEVKKAETALKAALKTRLDAGAPPVDPAVVGNACDLAELVNNTERPKEALAVLDPYVQAFAASKPTPEQAPLATRILTERLRAHVGLGQLDEALNDMKGVETSGGAGSGQAQLYYRLGRLLEKEIEARQRRNDRRGLAEIRAAYLKFLESLAASKVGQTFESLQWAGEQMLAIDRPKEARAVFDRVLATYEADPSFKGRPEAATLLFQAHLRRSAALRQSRDFAEAAKEVESLLASHRNTIEARMEQALLAEARAEAGAGGWEPAFNAWRTLALQLGGSGPKRPEYFESWYHAALALHRQKKETQAKQTLASVMRLSPGVGGPAMKAKYQDLLKQIGP